MSGEWARIAAELTGEAEIERLTAERHAVAERLEAAHAVIRAIGPWMGDHADEVVNDMTSAALAEWTAATEGGI